MDDPIIYAKVGGPPHDWQNVKIIDLDTGAAIDLVHEVNTSEGWLVRSKRNAEGSIYADPDGSGEVARERIEGRFEIRRPS